MRGLTSVAEVTADAVDGSSKSQNPNLKQIPRQNLKVRGDAFREIWDLKFVWSLGFGL
jgi:hypothetical protein